MKNIVRVSLLIAICTALILPKALLISYMNSALWGGFGAMQSFRLMLQDTILAAAVFGLLVVLTARPTRLWYILGAGGTSLILALLLIDARVRELWLRPLSWDLVDYCRQNAGDLSSGSDIFLKQYAGFGMTFRRFFAFALVAHWLLWGVAIIVSRVGATAAATAPKRWRLRYAIACICIVGMVVVARSTPAQLYQADRNILVGWSIDLVKPAGGQRGNGLADEFSQKLRPLADVNSQRILAGREIPPFSNVIIIFLESVRWRGLNLDTNGDTPAPTLRKLATEGLLAKCYVSLPHTSKAQFTVLTGTYPCSGVEIREAMRQRFGSVIWSLREHHRAKTFAFSVQHLPFENTSGMLRACGIETLVGPEQLRSYAGAGAAEHSSFGEDDSVLLQLPPDVLARAGEPFAAVFIPMAAHHPYNYPGKPADEGIGLAAYRHSIVYSDGILARLLKICEARGLLRDTLVVLVGDHGESFGEHGTFIHNNSMFEEEITVPLIFWSADGRLRGCSIRNPARQIDIAPTVADLMGLADPAYMVQGRSLLSDATDNDIYVFSFFEGVSTALVSGTEKLIYLPGNGQVSQYDLRSDPCEARPTLLEGDERDRVIRQLRAFQDYQRRRFE